MKQKTLIEENHSLKTQLNILKISLLGLKKENDLLKEENIVLREVNEFLKANVAKLFHNDKAAS